MIRRKLVGPLFDLLRQGVTPEKIALTIALGVTLGVTPLLGSATLLCTAAALLLRLNLPAIQIVNGVVYPLQLILLVPFLRAGAWLFGDGAAATLTLTRFFKLIRGDLGHAFAILWGATVHALVAWFAVSAVAACLIYFTLLPALRRVWRNQTESR